MKVSSTLFLTLLLALAGQAPLGVAANLPPELMAIQQKLFIDAFNRFAGDFGKAHPELHLKDAASVSPPSFDPQSSRNSWIDLFADRVAEASALSPKDTAALRESAQEMFTSYYHGVGYARVPYLEAVGKGELAGSARARLVRPLLLPLSYPRNHTLDVAGYVAERFPPVLQEFVRSKRVPLFLDDGDCGDAFAYQSQKGFTQAARFMGDRDNPDSQYLFVYNPRTQKYRFSVCQINGKDDQTRIIAILGPTFFFSGAFMVNHKQADPLFDFNPEGQGLRLDPVRDKVMIGFQNTIWWELSTTSSDWQRDSLTRSGTDVALFRNTKTGQRILSVENVYGDEMTETLNILYSMGARRFIYMGTAGALDPALKLGDVLLPSRFQKKFFRFWTSFANDALKINLAVDAPARIFPGTSQGWVGTLVQETKNHVADLRSQGVQAIDVESRYIAEFFKTHSAIEKTVIMVVSDLPLGKVNYNDENATRAIPMRSVSRLVPEVLAD